MALPNRRRPHRLERLAHLDPALRSRIEEDPLLGDLFVVHAGLFPEALGHLIDRPHGYESHQLAFLEKGRGFLRQGRLRIPVVEGDLFAFRGDVPVFYASDVEDPWTLRWVHFAGRRSIACLDTAGLAGRNPVRRIPVESRASLAKDLEIAHDSLVPSGSLRGALAGGEALRRIFLLLRSNEEPGQDDFSVRLLASLGGDPSRRISVPSWARKMGLPEALFRTRVKEATGESPVEYLTRRRLEKARDLLRFEGLSVRDAALRVGFEDPFYFSRRYRAVFGRSPLRDREG